MPSVLTGKFKGVETGNAIAPTGLDEAGNSSERRAKVVPLDKTPEAISKLRGVANNAAEVARRTGRSTSVAGRRRKHRKTRKQKKTHRRR